MSTEFFIPLENAAKNSVKLSLESWANNWNSTRIILIFYMFLFWSLFCLHCTGLTWLELNAWTGCFFSFYKSFFFPHIICLLRVRIYIKLLIFSPRENCLLSTATFTCVLFKFNKKGTSPLGEPLSISDVLSSRFSIVYTKSFFLLQSVAEYLFIFKHML